MAITQDFATLPITGNVIPHQWYSQIISDTGKPDYGAIALFSEIVYWYRPTKDGRPKFPSDCWQTSYQHFETKFGFNKQRIRRSLVRLEELGLIQRELRTIEKFGQKYSNVLFIKLLNTPEQRILKTKSPSTQSFFGNNDSMLILDPEEEILDNLQMQKEGIVANFFDSTKHEFLTPSLQNEREHIDIENKEENITSRSTQKHDFANFSFCDKLKSLEDFYPLTEKEELLLQKTTGRDFSLNFINQMLLHLAGKYPDHKFASKQIFMNYMSKILLNELRQTPKVNKTNYQLLLTKDAKEQLQHQQKIEKYLTELENSQDNTLENKLRKKLAGRLEPAIAFELLPARLIMMPKRRTLQIVVKKPIILDELSEKSLKAIILQEAQAVYGEEVQEIVITKELEGREDSATEIDLWSRARQRLVKNYGEATDSSWFSKLIIEYTAAPTVIKLKAPTNFIRDWVQQHYSISIERELQALAAVKMVEYIV